MSYEYSVLTPYQIRLLDKYEPWTKKVALSELVDQALVPESLGIMYLLVIPPPNVGDPAGYGNALIGQDLYVARNAFISGYLQVGGGYGSTGWTAFADGSTAQDGAADFSVGGFKMKEEAIATAVTAGNVGEACYGEDGGVWYLYVCVAADTWRRTALVSW